MLTLEDKQRISTLLNSLTEISRQNDCSDRFFRQVYTARVNAIKASGIMERIAADIAESEAQTTKATKPKKDAKEEES